MNGVIARVWSRAAAALLGAVLLLPDPARGVIIDTVTGTGNTTAPADDPGWGNMGTVNNGSAVYLGNRWVLTANHVGSGSTTLSGTTYAAVPGSNVILSNNGAAGRTANTDLLMYRLVTDPGLPALAIAATTPQETAAVTMIGAGRDRGAFTTWFVDVNTNPYTWTVDTENPNAAGYFWDAGRTMRWGTNAVTGSASWIDYNPGFSVSAYTFRTTFDNFPGDSAEGQAAVGDSGGAVFFKNGASWELAGIMLAIDAYSGQPGGTSVFGNNTYAADLAYYRPQIVSVVPEPSAVGLSLAGVAVAGSAAIRRRRRVSIPVPGSPKWWRPHRFGEAMPPPSPPAEAATDMPGSPAEPAKLPTKACFFRSLDGLRAQNAGPPQDRVRPPTNHQSAWRRTWRAKSPPIGG